MPQTFEAAEDESGRFTYPRWYVFDTETGAEVAGPFDTEIEAEDTAAEMTITAGQGE